MSQKPIDAETLQERLSQNTSTPKEEQKACEFCNSVSIYVRGTGYYETEHDYRCTHCGNNCDGTGDATAETIPAEEVEGP